MKVTARGGGVLDDLIMSRIFDKIMMGVSADQSQIAEMVLHPQNLSMRKYVCFKNICTTEVVYISQFCTLSTAPRPTEVAAQVC